MFFLNYLYQVSKREIAKKYFSLPELYILLQIVSCGFRNAKIFHGFGHNYAQLITYPEIMVNRVFAGHYHSIIGKYIYAVFPEFFGRDALYLYKRPEINFYTVVPRNVKIRGTFNFGLRLRNEYFLYLHSVLFFPAYYFR